MSQSDRAIKKLATDLARLKREVVSWRGAQADYTSIENGGNFTFKDGDGNVTAIVGGQDDGSNTIRHVDGPVPPVPSGLTAHVDGPIVQVSWDGTFEDADEATYDWSHLEVVAVGPDNTNLRATINDVTGATANLAATVSGEWTVAARSVSRAEKRSLDGDAGTVEVKLVDIDGAIDDAIGSANGKNTVTYSEAPPTLADEGIVGDTWFVGQVGRPNDIIEGTNLARNPGAHPDGTPWGWSGGSGVTATMSNQVRGGLNVARATYTAGSSYLYLTSVADYSNPANMAAVVPGTVISARMLVASSVARSLSLRIGFRTSSGEFAAWSAIGPSVSVPADGDLVELKIEGQTVPVGAAFAYVHTTNAPGVGTWVEGTRAMFEVSPTVSPYFDGDTTDGLTDNEPHYRWTGTPHASTSEKYLPAIPDSGSDAWNITEQWQYTSAGWKPVEVSHEVIATVDLGKATVGELDGIRIMGKTVRGEQLSGDAIDGKVITGATYRTSGGNGSWSDAGLFIAQPDGTSMVRFPTDGSPLSLTASDTQIERASVGELDLVDGAIRSGGQLTLASGVTAPPSPPELSAGWKFEAQLPRPAEPSMDWTGLAYWNGLYVRGVNVLGSAGDSADRIELYNPDGSLNRSISIDLNPRAGVAVIGDIVYTIGPDHVAANAGKQWCHGFNLNTGARVSRWEYVNFFAANQKKISIGVDGSNLLVAGVAPNSVLHVFKYNPSTGVQVGAHLTDTGWNLQTQEIFGAQQVGADIYITHRGFTRVYTVTGDTMTRKPGGSNGSNWAGWKNPNENAGGTVFVSGAPLVADSGAVYTGSEFTSDTTIQACFTWTNGTQETTPSPVASLAFQAFESATLSVAKRAGLQKRLYVKIGTGAWSRIDLSTDATAFVLTGPVGVPASLPSSNTFPASTPAVLKSGIGSFEVKGDGSGHWGPLVFNADGTLTSTQIPEWVPITSFSTGYGPQTWGFAPAYRVWPDGKVEWRGVVQGNFDTTGKWKVPFTMPNNARPAQAVNTTAASTGTGSLLKRVEFSPTADASEFRVYGGDADSTWVSLEGIYYYRS